MGKPIDITGKKFGKLTVLGVHHLGKETLDIGFVNVNVEKKQCKLAQI